MQTPHHDAINSQKPTDAKLPHKTCVYLWTFAFSFGSDAFFGGCDVQKQMQDSLAFSP